jgi:hypothetical protein
MVLILLRFEQKHHWIMRSNRQLWHHLLIDLKDNFYELKRLILSIIRNFTMKNPLFDPIEV